MARILKYEPAKRDRIAQWVWYAENASIKTADRFLTAAEATVAMLVTQPQAGLRTLFMNPELQRTSRFPVTGGFEKILTFPPRTGSIWFALHASRDIERLLADGFFRNRTEPD